MATSEHDDAHAAADPRRLLDAKQALHRAARAMNDGNGWLAAAALMDSPLLDGMVRRLSHQHKSLGWPGAQDVLAEAIDALVVHVENGGRPERPDAWLWKACRNKVVDEFRRRETLLDYQDHENAASLRPIEEAGDGVSQDVLRREAIRVVREHLPQVAQVRQRETLELIVDGVEREIEVSNAQIADALGVTTTNARKLRERAFAGLDKALAESGHHLTLRQALQVEDEESDEDDEA
jgi:RNA polymerase sigma factor (sigma-70 family)